ncbi:MAG: hypothetical protein ACRDJM_09440, partial [Actinomycetota bacterium]
MRTFRMRAFAIVIVALVAVAPSAGTAARLPLDPVARNALSATDGARRALAEFANTFPKGAPFGDQILRTGLVRVGAAVPRPAPAVRPGASFDAALRRLY